MLSLLLKNIPVFFTDCSSYLVSYICQGTLKGSKISSILIFSDRHFRFISLTKLWKKSAKLNYHLYSAIIKCS